MSRNDAALPAEIAVLDKFMDNRELETLLERVRRSPKTKIILRGNCLGGEGAKVLGDYLVEECSELVELSLEWNQLGSAGCVILANSLEKNTSLKVLDLRNNNIKSEGALALAQALQVNQSIRSIDLRWNQIEDDGALAFKTALLNRNPPLRLQLGGNHLTSSGVTLLENWQSGEDADACVSPTAASSVASATSVLPIQVDRFGSEDTENIRPLESDALANSNAASRPPLIVWSSPAGLSDANNQRLQKDCAALRQQCKAFQDEIIGLAKQLELSAVRVTELEQTVLKEEFKFQQADEQMRHAHARILVQSDERSRLVQQFDAERESSRENVRLALAKRDAEISSLCMERDRALQETRLAQDNAQLYKSQMEEHASRHNQERLSLQEELGSVRRQLTDSSLSEARLKSEVGSLENRVARAEDAGKSLEAELRAARAAADAEIRLVHQSRDEAESKIRADCRAQLEISSERILALSQDLQDLQSKKSVLETEYSSSKADLELKCEKAVTLARQEEAKRTEAVTSDLRAKVDMFVTARAELEKRCAEYLAELTSSQSGQKDVNKSIVKQLNSAEQELARLREANATLREECAVSAAEARASGAELAELRERVAHVDELNAEMKSKLAIAIASEGSTALRAQHLQMKASKYEDDRRTEFYSVVDAVVGTVTKQFATLQTSLQIPPRAKSSLFEPAAGNENYEEESGSESADDEDEGDRESDA
jgi:hypothetical protein